MVEVERLLPVPVLEGQVHFQQAALLVILVELGDGQGDEQHELDEV